jgi:flavin-binding protein dodecin
MTEPRVARVTEIIAGSPKGFDEATKVGFARATKTLRGITGMKIIEMRVAVENSKIIEYRVRLEVIFVLET